MDIQQAINLLSNENHKYFVEQINHFEIDTTKPLKYYLDFINSDIIGWFKSAPTNIKAESTYYKFKSPLGTLLQNKDIVQEYGLTYCNTLSNNITTVFSKHKKEILKERKTNNVTIEDTRKDTINSTSDTSSEIIEDTDDEQEDDSGLGHPDQWVNKDISTTTNDDYKQKYENLQLRYDNLQESYDTLTKDYHYVKGQFERTDSELSRVWEFLNKFASK